MRRTKKTPHSAAKKLRGGSQPTTGQRGGSQPTTGQRGGVLCPPEFPPSLCKLYIEQLNVNQALRNKEKNMLSENVRVQQARKSFNWKSQDPKFAAIREGTYINNINNSELLNVHEATNENFPNNTNNIFDRSKTLKRKPSLNNFNITSVPPLPKGLFNGKTIGTGKPMPLTIKRRARPVLPKPSLNNNLKSVPEIPEGTFGKKIFKINKSNLTIKNPIKRRNQTIKSNIK